MSKVIEEKLERGVCFFCGQPAELMFGYWSFLKPMAMTNEQGWRTIRVCEECNDKKKIIDHNSLEGTFVGYA